MSHPNPASTRRLQRLQRVLAGRQRRLAATLERRSMQAVGTAGPLQRYGYAVAAVLALAAVLPTALGFALRHRRVLARAASAGSDAQKWSRLLEDLRTPEAR